MRIRTQLFILMLLFSAMLVVIALSAVITNLRAERALAQGKLAGDIAEGASQLGYLSNDYLMYREPQQRERWRAKYAAVSEQIAALSVVDPEEQALVLSVRDSERRIKEVFDSIDGPAAAGEPARPVAGLGASAIDVVQLRVAWSRMGVQTQGLLTDAQRLADLLGAEADRALRVRTVLIYATIAVFGTFFLLNYFTVQQRILRALEALRQGALTIGAGDLDHQIPVERGRGQDGPTDEIGEVSAAFNTMAASLKENRAQLQAYARRLVDASEHERRTLARELHDEAGQVMTALKMSLARLQRRRDLPPDFHERLEEAKELADRVIDDLRTIAADLRPGALDRAGLAPALEQHVELFCKRTGLNVQFAAKGFDDQRERLAPETETNLYRIAQEALTNAARYGRPARVDVLLERTEREVTLTVQDDGQGFDLEEARRKGHLGLMGMRERTEALNGRLAIESSPGKGTKIRVTAPAV